MNNTVKEFLSDVFGEVRAFEKDGNLWFVAKDICDILGTKTKDIPKVLNNKGIDSVDILTNGGNQRMTCVMESSLYKLIFKSRKPFAEEFQDWICGTVIPALRKDGGYIDGEEKVISGEMSEDELVLKAMTVMQSKIERLRKEVDRYSKLIGDKMSKVTKKELAGRLGCTPQRLAKILKEYDIYTPKSNEISQWFLDMNKDINVILSDDYDGVNKNGKEFSNKGWQYTGEGAIRVVKFLEEKDLVKYSENDGFVLK